MADNIAKVVMIDRSVYDNLNPPENNTIYFVREGSPYTSKALSLYVGEAKQCDLLDITGEATFDPQTNEYSIPQAYRIDGKLLFSQQTIVTEKLNPGDQKTDDNSYSFFRISMWDSTSGKFKDCTGFPNNVILVKDGQLPYSGSQGVPGDAIKDFIYVDVMNRSIYVFDGNSYIPIIDLSQYATKEWVQDYHDSHPTPVNIDNVTILKDTINNVPDTLHGAGADVSGKTFMDTDSTPSTPMIASTGSHIFNNYTNNIAVKPYSSVFGSYNEEKKSDNELGCNIISGSNNKVKSADCSIISGNYNQIMFSGIGLRTFTYGARNSIYGSGSFSYQYGPIVTTLGINNNIQVSKVDSSDPSTAGSSIFINGYSNSATVSENRQCTILGHSNSFTASGGSEDGHTLICGESNTVTNVYGQFITGYRNSFTNSGFLYDAQGSSIIGCYNAIDTPSSVRVFLIGSENIVSKNGNTNPSCGASYITETGSNNEIVLSQSDIAKVKYCNILGYNNSIIRNTSDVNYSTVVGNSLYSEWSNCLVMGIGNTTTLPTLHSGTDPIIIIGSQDTKNSGPRRNIAIVTSENEMLYYGDVTDAGTDMSLKTSFRTVTVTPSSGAVTLANLPRNGDETILSYDMGDSSNPVSLTSITISDLSVPIMGTATDVGLDVANGEVDDYCATIAFRPNAQTPISDVTTLLTNFNPTGQEPRIYLMNPDIDVSTYTVIHLLLFYDGFNVCCTVAGYEEVPTV